MFSRRTCFKNNKNNKWVNEFTSNNHVVAQCQWAMTVVMMLLLEYVES